MKKFFKWIGYILLSLVVIVVAAVLFLVNSTKTIEWAADKYAPQYGFGYKQISGGLLTGLEVEGLTFEDDVLLDRFKVGWNPTPLLHKKVSVTHLEATGLDVENIKKVVAAFSSDKPKEEDNSTFVLPVSIGLGKLHVTLKPFDESGIEFREIALDGSDLVYDGERIDVEKIQLLTDTNIAAMELIASSKDKVVRVKRFSILDIDSITLESVVKGIIEEKAHEEVVEKVDVEAEHHKKGEENLLPERVLIDSVLVTVKPAERPEIKISHAELSTTSIEIAVHDIIDRKPDAISVEELMLALDTNLTTVALSAGLKGDTVTVNTFSIKEIDTLALVQIFAPKESNTSQADIAETQEQKDEAVEEENAPNPLIPKYLVLKHLDTSIKSAEYDPVLVKSAEVNASDIVFNIVSLAAESGTIDIDAKTSFADLVQHGVIKNNQIESRGHITPLKMLFETYKIPLREDALGNITLDINANKEKAQVDITIEGKEILQAEEGGFNVNTLHLTNHIVYLIPESKLRVANEGNISTPYAKNIRLHNLLTFESGELKYNGEVVPGTLEGIDANYTKPLNDLKITYEGNISSVTALIDSEGLKGKFISPDFKKGDFNLSTKEAIVLKNIVSLPEPLQESKVAMNVHVPLDFAKITPLNANAMITSNLANITARVLYDKELKVETETIFPKDSLLRGFSKELNLDALSPLLTDVSMNKNRLNVDLHSNGLTSKVNYGLEDKNVTGDLVLGGAKFLFKGNVEKEVSLENSVGSLQDLLKKIHTIYAFEAPPLDGDMKLSLVLKQMKEVELLLSSNTLTYQADRKTEHILNDTMISLGFSDSVLKLNKYHTTFQKQKIFATKPSQISLKDGAVDISPLWLNDQLKVTGRYNIEEKKGEILAFADTFDVSHEMIDMSSHINIKTKLDGVRTDIDGTVTILGGNVYYDMDKKSFASDSDIIIVQDMKEKEPSPFMDNLTALIKVNTKKPLVYKTADANIKIKADMLIQKAPKGPIYILGTAEVLKGSFYAFENKKFVFKKSIIAFTGDPTKPILDIAAIYNSINYEITIQVTGDPATPNIIFSSIPRLSREQILSVILFDSEDAAGSNSGDDMMKMMGGAMAKSALSNMGIKIDHLSLGSDGSMEIGKKIYDKVTIIYVNEEVAGAKLQYDYSKYIKATISTDAKSSGADIIYRREFGEFK